MKKTSFKKLTAMFIAALMLMSLIMTMPVLADTTASGFEVSEWYGRRKEFTSETDDGGWNNYWYPIADERGGVVTFDTSGDGYLYLTRTDDSSPLGWFDYCNGTAGLGNGYVNVKLTKTSDADVLLYNVGNSGDFFFDVKWASDGKFYAKYRENAGDGSPSSFSYLCDIEGDTADVWIYCYEASKMQCIEVNGKLVLAGKYSENTTPNTIIERLVVELQGPIGAQTAVDYMRYGSITSTPFVPAGISCDASDLEDDSVLHLSYDFMGYDSSVTSGVMIAALRDNMSDAIESLQVFPVTNEIITSTELSTSLNADFAVAAQDAVGKYIEVYLWDGLDSMRPLAPKATLLALIPVPSMSGVIRSDNFDNGVALSDGQFYVYDTYGSNAQFTEENNKFNMICGDGGYYEATAYANGGSNYGSGILSYTVSKSAGSWGRVTGLNFYGTTFYKNGAVGIMTRNSLEDGEVQYPIVLPASDKLDHDIVVKFDGSAHTYSLWIDSRCVAYNAYAYTDYPQVYQIRMSNELPSEGDTLSISNYVVGY